jgi:HEAT repeat protein
MKMITKKLKYFRNLLIIAGLMVAPQLVQIAYAQENLLDRTDRMLESLSKLERHDANIPEYSELVGEIFSDRRNLGIVKPGLTRFFLSGASHAGKRYFFEELTRTGNSLAIGFAAEMLLPEETADLALMTLYKIPGDEVNKALRNAFRSCSPEIQTGIIAALGMRNDESSVRFISGFINHQTEQIALASISALGKIGNAAATTALTRATSRTIYKEAVMEALLEAAEQLAKNNQLQQAFRIYKHVHDSDPPAMIALASFRGMLATTSDNPVNMMAEKITNPGKIDKNDLIDLVKQLPPAYQVGARLLHVRGLSDAEKMRLITNLAARNDREIYRDLTVMINNDDPVIREAAILALSAVATQADVKLLAEIASERTGREQELAREVLYRLPGEDVDRAILREAQNVADDKGAELIRAISERNITNGTDILLAAAQSSHQGARTEAYRSLGRIATPEHIEAVINLLFDADNNRDRQEIQRTLQLIATRTEPAKTAIIVEHLENTTDKENTSALIAVLGNIKNPGDMEAIASYLDHEDQDLKLSAVRALSDWPDAQPARKLRELVVLSNDVRLKTLALRGHTQVLLNDKSMSADLKAEQLSIGLQHAPNVAEKRFVISALGNTVSMNSLESLVNQLQDEGVRNETEVAILNVAGRLIRSEPEKTKSLLQQALNYSDNAEIRKLIAD